MAFTFCGPLNQWVCVSSALLHLVLMVHWTSVSSAPTPSSINSITRLLVDEVDKLKIKYVNFHGPRTDPGPDDLPGLSGVSGFNVSEKLLDIVKKSRVLLLHMERVVQQHQVDWESKTLTKDLTHVKERLRNLKDNFETFLKNCFPGIPLPAAPTPLPPTDDDHFAHKREGWYVLVRLEQWSRDVLLFLDKTKGEMCG